MLHNYLDHSVTVICAYPTNLAFQNSAPGMHLLQQCNRNCT